MKTCAEIQAIAAEQRATMREIGKKLAEEALQANGTNMEIELTDKGNVVLTFNPENNKYGAVLRSNSLRDSETNCRNLAEIVATTVSAMLRELEFFATTVERNGIYCVKVGLTAYDADNAT
ncbi:MAG: hypothetical protein E6R04_01215 [Spirochaetes bacterium]|nr:MAG: hypothetical protein E6R04_01215 [Spirochaetota bacterium]